MSMFLCCKLSGNTESFVFSFTINTNIKIIVGVQVLQPSFKLKNIFKLHIYVYICGEFSTNFYLYFSDFPNT